jgi:hypothetical protein
MSGPANGELVLLAWLTLTLSSRLQMMSLVITSGTTRKGRRKARRSLGAGTSSTVPQRSAGESAAFV